MAKLQEFLLRLRHLRAIPSLVVLTTAIAWGVASDPDVLDTVSKKAGITLVQRAGSPAGDGRPDVPVLPGN
ncbi:MAG: hypothetical protein H7228_03765 [Polaromonas sp.]|nr:hypothetical protein [Polaromonas sp.]